MVKQHPRACLLYDPSHFVLQQLDYLEYIDLYHARIKAFHVKDAEFRPTGRQGVYGGFAPWLERAGRFRSLGDGQVDFRAIFSKLTQYGYRGWAVLEWECCLKHPEQGAAEGAPFIREHLIRVADRAFDDFAASTTDAATNRRMMGIASAWASAGARKRILGGRRLPRDAATLRLGMVGGGEGAFIGAVHRFAARLDDEYELVAAAPSSNAERARSSGEQLRLAPDRVYTDYRDMARAESQRDDGIDVVAIVVPNHLHFDVARAFLEAGTHVICDKPLRPPAGRRREAARAGHAASAACSR